VIGLKKYAVISTLLSLVATALFIAGIIFFKSAESTPVGGICVCLGFVCLSIGIFFSRKDRKGE
jgi:uncharacterized membrane protein YgdD (TMEM256/DUF423 family)